MKKKYLYIMGGLVAVYAAYWTVKQIPFFFRVLAEADRKVEVRKELFDEIRPVALKNCELKRFGADDDGGYLACANLIPKSVVAYSYGIQGRDEWGCHISRDYGFEIHQYDCFDTRKPKCEGGKFVFHPECLSGSKFTEEGRDFDTLKAQFERNGHGGKRIFLKMDIEGSEWSTFLESDEATLLQIDQMSVELHGAEQDKYLNAIRRLKKYFFIANVHFNNNDCHEDHFPLPSDIYEILFVNKKLVEVDPSSKAPHPHPLDRPNQVDQPDCQAKF